MVETNRQYEFIYEVVNEVLSKVDQNTEMTNQNVEELYQNLIATDPLTGLTGIQKLFRNLNRGQETESSMVKKLEGSKDINEYKNRYAHSSLYHYFHVFTAGSHIKLDSCRDIYVTRKMISSFNEIL